MFIRRCAKTPSIGGCVIDVPSNEVENFELNGYAVVRGLFSGDEVAVYIDHFMRLRDADTHTNDSHSADLADESERGWALRCLGRKRRSDERRGRGMRHFLHNPRDTCRE